MAKLKAKHILTGVGTDQVNDGVFPSIYTPTNYTPAQVSTEGNDKISAHLKGIDNALGSVVPPIRLEIAIQNDAINVSIPGSGYNPQERGMQWNYYISRQNETDAFNCVGSFYTYKDANGEYQITMTAQGGEEAGITFSINELTGVLSYSSTDLEDHDEVESYIRLVKLSI